MFSGIDISRIKNAYEKVSGELLAQRNQDGYWTGRLSDSAPATATAVSAFAVFRNAVRKNTEKNQIAEEYRNKIESVIRQGVEYLAGHQNTDGGWGDTDKSVSNLSATLLVKSALLLSDMYDSESLSSAGGEKTGTGGDRPAPRAWHNSQIVGWSMDLLGKADVYIRNRGGIEAVKQSYGIDRTFSASILTNAALAGLVPWRNVPQLPFERAALPMFLHRFVHLHAVSYALPALAAVGLVRFRRYQSHPVMSLIRNAAVKRTLHLIEKMQPESGGYLEAVPLTAFTVMCLADCAGAEFSLEYPVIQNGLKFLLNTVRENGSWAIGTNLAVRLTSQSMTALAAEKKPEKLQISVDWLSLPGSRHTKRHPITGAAPSGWGWTNSSGAVPHAGDTAAVLSALAVSNAAEHIGTAAAGIRRLLQLRNRDGGVPVFCRGWEMLPLDRSSTDITAHTVRVLRQWIPVLQKHGGFDTLVRKMNAAEQKMLLFLKRKQKPDGSWLPLCFGSQYHLNGENPVYGTAKVLSVLAEIDSGMDIAVRGLQFLLQNQNQDGGWGSRKAERTLSGQTTRSRVQRQTAEKTAGAGSFSTIEETAVVIEALTPFAHRLETASVLQKGLEYLLEKIESDKHRESAPIGLCFSKLWYCEELYPLIFTVSALKNIAEKCGG
ncbi:MAG: hypothetical protein LBT46_08270 [Planctomycetaceae bacterium]|jgi:squalene-hopene/tetraprenyl-beta-curcumene cyclase|nr:hypothetical protein [Planctomycetaceae bacterium]